MRLVMSSSDLAAVSGGVTYNVAGGVFLKRFEEVDGVFWTVHSILNSDGTETRLFAARGGFRPELIGFDTMAGVLWLLDESGDLYVLDGLPRARSGGPGGPADLHPGELDGGVFRAEGDGEVTVFDAIIVLRASVGLVEIE